MVILIIVANNLYPLFAGLRKRHLPFPIITFAITGFIDLFEYCYHQKNEYRILDVFDLHMGAAAWGSGNDQKKS